MLKRLLHRWGWAAMRRAGVTSDLVELDRWLDDVAAHHRAEAEAIDAAVEGARRFASCLVNGLRIAGPGDLQ